MAREMHLARIAVDWWTLGILLFEFMAGHPPFESPTPVETYSKVMMLACNSIGIYTEPETPNPMPVLHSQFRKGIGKVKMPPKCQGAIGDLIKGVDPNPLSS